MLHIFLSSARNKQATGQVTIKIKKPDRKRTSASSVNEKVAWSSIFAPSLIGCFVLIRIQFI